jgi:hypothetical protein
MLILSLAFVVPTFTTAQEKKGDDSKTGDDKKETKAKPKEKQKPDWGMEIVGKLTVVDAKDEKEFTVQVQLKVPEPNPNGQQQYLQAQQQVAQAQIRLAQAKKPQDVQSAMQALASAQQNLAKAYANLTKVKDVNLDFKCNVMDKMRVRSLQPQTEVDEKTGEFKKLTKKEMDELRADGWPGYPADFKNLAVGQTVHVYFSKDTKTPGSLYIGKDKKAVLKNPDDLQDDLNNFRYDVIQILILAEPPAKKN